MSYAPYICILVLCAVYSDPINQLTLHLHSLAMSHCLTPVSMPQLSLLFESWTRWRVDGPKLLNPEKKEAFCLLLVLFFFCFLFRHRSRSNSYLTFTAALSYSKYNKFGLQGLWTIEYIRAFHGIARGFFFRFVGFAHAHAFLWHSRFYSMTHESQDLQSAHQRQPWPQTPSLVLDLCLCLWGSGLLFKLQDDVDFFYIPLAAIVILSKVYPWRLTGCFVCGNLRIESEC